MSAAPDPDTLAQLALQDLQNGQVAAAESKCLQALAVKGRHPRALSVLGVILHSRGRDEDAVRVFNALTQFEPNDARHWENLGAALRPTKRYDSALAAYDEEQRDRIPSGAVVVEPYPWMSGSRSACSCSGFSA